MYLLFRFIYSSTPYKIFWKKLENAQDMQFLLKNSFSRKLGNIFFTKIDVQNNTSKKYKCYFFFVLWRFFLKECCSKLCVPAHLESFVEARFATRPAGLARELARGGTRRGIIRPTRVGIIRIIKFYFADLVIPTDYRKNERTLLMSRNCCA